jgi:hypothetical protein
VVSLIKRNGKEIDMLEPNTDITDVCFIYCEQRGKDLYLIKDLPTCTVSCCVDYLIEQGWAEDLTSCEYCQIIKNWKEAHPLQIKNGFCCKCGKWHDLSKLTPIN